eukprot:9847938-Lingulodinium_polyedra.AAC.1
MRAQRSRRAAPCGWIRVRRSVRTARESRLARGVCSAVPVGRRAVQRADRAALHLSPFCGDRSRR